MQVIKALKYSGLTIIIFDGFFVVFSLFFGCFSCIFSVLFLFFLVNNKSQKIPSAQLMSGWYHNVSANMPD